MAKHERLNTSPDIERIKQQHRALAVLRFLEREPGSRSNDQVITARLDSIGLVGSRAQLTGCLDRLEASGLTVQHTVESLIVVELTAKGEEVAQGRCEFEGVLRPSVNCPY